MADQESRTSYLTASIYYHPMMLSESHSFAGARSPASVLASNTVFKFY